MTQSSLGTMGVASIKSPILGVGVDATSIPRVVEDLDRMIQNRTPGYVTVTGVHGIMESVRSDDVRAAHDRATLVVPDGMPLVWLLRAAGHAGVSRVYGPSLMLAVFEHAQQKGYRHYLYGSAPATLDRLQANLEARFPGCVIAGRHSPPFRRAGDPESDEVIAEINDSRPDIVWVGLSTPKQELWMTNHRARLTAPVLVGVGAAFDFHAGLVRQAPPLLQQMGLEWAFRMAMEPRRLAMRYIKNNPAFIALLLAEQFRLKRY